MEILVRATAPSNDRRPYIKWLAWLLAGVLLIMALGQLFAFEKFVPLVESFWLPGGTPVAYVTASMIVVSEVFALPYLLGMRISSAMRAVSAGCAVIAPSIWLAIATWLNVTTNAVANIGFLGTKVVLPVGLWAIFFAFSLLVLAIWIVWGRPPVFGARQ